MVTARTQPPNVRLSEEDVASALGSRAQRDVLAACIAGPLSVKQISEATGVPIASTYRQVNSLQESGLLVVERSALTVDGKPYDLYRSRVTRAAIEISIHGARVSWDCDASREDRLIGMWRQLRGLA